MHCSRVQLCDDAVRCNESMPGSAGQHTTCVLMKSLNRWSAGVSC